MGKYLAVISALIFTGCTSTAAPVTAPGAAGMANPASVYCLQQGGTLHQVHYASGVSNNCHLPGGEVIDEWALFHRDHPR